MKATRFFFIVAALALLAYTALFIYYCATGALAHSPRTINISLLEEIICNYETRGEKDRNAAVSSAQAISKCQLLPTTLKDLGIGYWEVHDEEVSHQAANMYITWCYAKGNTTIYSIAYCYNPSVLYAKEITLLYDIKVQEQHWDTTRRWKASSEKLLATEGP